MPTSPTQSDYTFLRGDALFQTSLPRRTSSEARTKLLRQPVAEDFSPSKLERLVTEKERLSGHADINQDRISHTIFTDF